MVRVPDHRRVNAAGFLAEEVPLRGHYAIPLEKHVLSEALARFFVVIWLWDSCSDSFARPSEHT